ncbi:MAG: hypothetical protein ACTSRO_03300 [Candidatus Heimdallarchaeaceae archaeon]
MINRSRIDLIVGMSIFIPIADSKGGVLRRISSKEMGPSSHAILRIALSRTNAVFSLSKAS